LLCVAKQATCSLSGCQHTNIPITAQKKGAENVLVVKALDRGGEKRNRTSHTSY